jgi:CDP-glucose 4,6-dehydratase
MSFWRGKKVLITGHTGFKGSWLALWLQHLQADVIGFALSPPTTPNLFTAANVAANMTSVIGDIRDFEQLQQIIAKHRPEIVFHLAAQSLVRHSYGHPIETYATNVLGTVHLFEALRRTGGAKAVLNITTDKCYENKEWHWGYRENDTLGGYDPYSNSKACSELVTAAYRNSYFNPHTHAQHDTSLASARAGNVIGGGDWAHDRLIPDLIRSSVAGETTIIRHPHALRPWQHVLEPLSGYLLLAQKLHEHPLEFAEAWNFGPDDNDVKPVNWIADYVTNLWGDNAHWILDQNPQPHEATYLKLDCAKAKARLGWRPRWNLEKALQETVRWYQAYENKQAMQDVTLQQINHYTTLED